MKVDRWRRPSQIAGAVCVLLLALIAIVFATLVLGIWWGLGAVALTAYCFVSLLRTYYQRHVPTTLKRDSVLEHGRCAACGYDLSGHVSTCEDHLVRCPECGAQWKRRRFTPLGANAE